MQDDSPFGALQFTVDELELDVSKGAGLDGILPLILKNCAAAFALPLFHFFTDFYRLVFFLKYGNYPGTTTLQIIMGWLYYLQFRSVLNCWFIELCTKI
jgi:hypothetical protein